MFMHTGQFRRYKDGDRLSYVMKGRHNDRPFEVRLTAVVKKGADGRFVEEYAWSDLTWGGEAQPLTPSSRDFRRAVTLAGGEPFTFPDLSRVQPGLIGPVTDLLTFYSDLFLAMHAGHLRAPGDHFLVPNPMVSETYVASAGKETFDVELKVRLSTGEIVSATLDNLVEAVARDCRIVELTECGEPRPDRTVRRIEMMLIGQ
jgi:hypothetical protein